MIKNYQVIIQTTTKYGTFTRSLREYQSSSAAMVLLTCLQEFLDMRKQYLAIDKLSPSFEDEYNSIISQFKSCFWFSEQFPMFSIMIDNENVKLAGIAESLDDAWIQEIYR